MLRAVLAVAAFLVPMAGSPAVAAPCTPRLVAAGGAPLWVDLEGAGTTTVVFESGNGEDSSVWADMAPRVRALGVRTLIYDRAGLGKSALRPGRYTIDRDADALRAVLTACGVRGPVVIATHSYGGFVSLRTAARDTRIAGLVMIDANVPQFFDGSETDAILAQYRPQYAEVRDKAPALAKALIPVIEAYPASARTLRATRIPHDLPIIDIVAEHSWVETPEAMARWRAAHAAFDAQSPSREAVQATGSGHHVMRDKPDLVYDAIARMIGKVSASASTH